MRSLAEWVRQHCNRERTSVEQQGTEVTGTDLGKRSTAFYHDKATIVQEARVFNESPISPRRCRSLLTRILFLLYAGETFTTQEATTLFFGVTKLFQHKDVRSKRLLFWS